MAYYEYVQQLRTEVSSESEFHMKKVDRLFCARRRDFNSLYKKYCDEEFGGKTRNKMFDQLRVRSASTRRNIPVVNCRISYLTHRDQSPLLLQLSRR